MAEIYDDEFRLEFYGDVTHVVAISLEGFTGKDVVPVKRIEDHLPNSRYSNQLLSADCSDHGFARFVEKSFDSDGGVICPSAYFLFGSSEWRVDAMLEKDIAVLKFLVRAFPIPLRRFNRLLLPSWSTTWKGRSKAYAFPRFPTFRGGRAHCAKTWL